MSEKSVPASTRFRSKWVAGLMGLLTGSFGLHRLYLGQAMWWLYPLIVLPLMGYALRQEEWFREPAFFVAAVVVVIAFLETILIGLTPAEKWDARFNGPLDQKTAGGTLAVVIAIIALMAGTVLLMSVMALALEGFFVARRS